MQRAIEFLREGANELRIDAGKEERRGYAEDAKGLFEAAAEFDRAADALEASGQS